MTGSDPTSPRSLLADAARTNQAWLRVALSRFVPPGADRATPLAVELLGDIAAYRARWQERHPAPLGIAAHTDEQARELDVLAERVHAGLGAKNEAPSPGVQQTDLERDQAMAELDL